MTRASLCLACLCVLLAGAVSVELLPASREPGSTAEPAAPPALSQTVPTPPRAAWAGVALGRPLFATDRRPPTAGPAATTALPRLSGTICADQHPLAIFQPDGGGKPVVVGREATVAGWRVVDIADGLVTLARGEKIAVLRLGWAPLPVLAQPVMTQQAGPPSPVAPHGKRPDPFRQP